MSADVLDLLVTRARHRQQRRVPGARPAGPDRAVRHRRPDTRRAEVPAVRAGHACELPQRRAPCSAPSPTATSSSTTPTTRSPPRRAAHRAGRRRPAGAGDQADAVPDERRVADRDALIDAAEAGKQVVVRGGDQGPVRRGREHRLGPQAGAGRLPRRVRPRRAEDPLQAACVVREEPDGTCAATATSAPATTTRRRPGCTRTSACSPPTPRSARTSPTCSTT